MTANNDQTWTKEEQQRMAALNNNQSGKPATCTYPNCTTAAGCNGPCSTAATPATQDSAPSGEEETYIGISSAGTDRITWRKATGSPIEGAEAAGEVPLHTHAKLAGDLLMKARQIIGNNWCGALDDALNHIDIVTKGLATAPAPQATGAGERTLAEEVQFLRNVVNDAAPMLVTADRPKTAELLLAATRCVERAALAQPVQQATGAGIKTWQERVQPDFLAYWKRRGYNPAEEAMLAEIADLRAALAASELLRLKDAQSHAMERAALAQPVQQATGAGDEWELRRELGKASVGACNCNAKSPLRQDHAYACRYRALDAAMTYLDSRAALAQPSAEPVATVIKKGALRKWMSERLGSLPDGTYSLYLAPAAPAVAEGAVRETISTFLQNNVDNLYADRADSLAEGIVRVINVALAAQPALPLDSAQQARRFGKLDVMEAWACVRKNNSSIADDALDDMRAVLLDSLERAPAGEKGGAK